ncbi:unnamed protein product [Ectocarpus sp. 13 AM-2016]
MVASKQGRMTGGCVQFLGPNCPTSFPCWSAVVGALHAVIVYWYKLYAGRGCWNVAMAARYAQSTLGPRRAATASSCSIVVGLSRTAALLCCTTGSCCTQLLLHTNMWEVCSTHSLCRCIARKTENISKCALAQIEHHAGGKFSFPVGQTSWCVCVMWKSRERGDGATFI